ncbi:MAG TPA: ribbon-helix-helix domain-containing protein [Gillisia sp.]|nr:ribbon-helix-helix domain-containing protein [Gillisia sp.]
MNKDKNMFDDFKKNVLSNKPETKKQKVIQDSESILKEEEPFTFWLPQSKMKALKLLSIESGSSLKSLLNEGVDLLLKKKG